MVACRAVEVQCMANGHLHCEFVVSPPAPRKTTKLSADDGKRARTDSVNKHSHEEQRKRRTGSQSQERHLSSAVNEANERGQ